MVKTMAFYSDEHNGNTTDKPKYEDLSIFLPQIGS
jgi:hypothetical protein